MDFSFVSEMKPDQGEAKQQQPFKVKIDQAAKKIVLEGDLDEFAEQSLRIALGETLKEGSHWVVDAAKLQVVPNGVKAWVKFAINELSGVGLTYLRSQLAMILQFDETYTHGNSKFLGESNGVW